MADQSKPETVKLLDMSTAQDDAKLFVSMMVTEPSLVDKITSYDTSLWRFEVMEHWSAMDWSMNNESLDALAREAALHMSLYAEDEQVLATCLAALERMLAGADDMDAEDHKIISTCHFIKQVIDAFELHPKLRPSCFRVMTAATIDIGNLILLLDATLLLRNGIVRHIVLVQGDLRIDIWCSTMIEAVNFYRRLITYTEFLAQVHNFPFSPSTKFQEVLENLISQRNAVLERCQREMAERRRVILEQMELEHEIWQHDFRAVSGMVASAQDVPPELERQVSKMQEDGRTLDRLLPWLIDRL